jgi:hypothetical protein
VTSGLERLCTELPKALNVQPFLKPLKLTVCGFSSSYKKLASQDVFKESRSKSLPTQLWVTLFELLTKYFPQLDFVLDLSPFSLFTPMEACFQILDNTKTFIRYLGLMRYPKSDSDKHFEKIIMDTFSIVLEGSVTANYETIWDALIDFSWAKCHQVTRKKDKVLDWFYSSCLSSPFLTMPGVWTESSNKKPHKEKQPSHKASKTVSQSEKSPQKRKRNQDEKEKEEEEEAISTRLRKKPRSKSKKTPKK